MNLQVLGLQGHFTYLPGYSHLRKANSTVGKQQTIRDSQIRKKFPEGFFSEQIACREKKLGETEGQSSAAKAARV